MKNYRQFGTGYKTPSDNKYVSQRKEIQNKVAAIESNLTDFEKQQIANTIEAIMKGSLNNDSNFKNAAEASINSKLARDFKKTYQNINTKYNITSGAMENVSTEGKISPFSASNVNGARYVDLNQIKQKIDTLETYWMEEISKGGDKNRFNEMISAYQKLLDQSLTDINKAIENHHFKEEILKSIPVRGKSATVKQLKDNLNYLIETYAAYPAISKAEGDGFEYTIALALNAATDLAEDKVQNSLSGNNIKMGEKRFKKTNFSSFVRKIGDDVFLNATYNKRAKVDIEVVWNDKLLKVSAKNSRYTDDFKSMVSLVNDSTLLFLLQDMDINAVNHFLNISSAHEGGSLKNEEKTIQEDIKRYLFYKGLSGDTYRRSRRDIPNIFIVNKKGNSKDPKVKVIDVQDIYKFCEDRLNMFSVKFSGINMMGLQKIDSVWVQSAKNTPAENRKAAKQRITNILYDLDHSTKVSVAFNGNILKSIN